MRQSPHMTIFGRTDFFIRAAFEMRSFHAITFQTVRRRPARRRPARLSLSSQRYRKATARQYAGTQLRTRDGHGDPARQPAGERQPHRRPGRTPALRGRCGGRGELPERPALRHGLHAGHDGHRHAQPGGRARLLHGVQLRPHEICHLLSRLFLRAAHPRRRQQGAEVRARAHSDLRELPLLFLPIAHARRRTDSRRGHHGDHHPLAHRLAHLRADEKSPRRRHRRVRRRAGGEGLPQRVSARRRISPATM